MTVRGRIEAERQSLAQGKRDDHRLHKRLGWIYSEVHHTAFSRGYIRGAEEGLAEGRGEARVMTVKLLSRAGLKQGKIAKLLDVNQSTVSRMLARGSG